MSTLGKISVGIVNRSAGPAMISPPRMATSIAATTKVYGRRRARRTIHIQRILPAVRQQQPQLSRAMMLRLMRFLTITSIANDSLTPRPPHQLWAVHEQTLSPRRASFAPEL